MRLNIGHGHCAKVVLSVWLGPASLTSLSAAIHTAHSLCKRAPSFGRPRAHGWGGWLIFPQNSNEALSWVYINIVLSEINRKSTWFIVVKNQKKSKLCTAAGALVWHVMCVCDDGWVASPPSYYWAPYTELSWYYLPLNMPRGRQQKPPLLSSSITKRNLSNPSLGKMPISAIIYIICFR